MASTTSNSDITPQVNAGIPAWLDFDTLRSAAIAYLGPVTGTVWTDYNVHDPGITTLEALIYALLDLGYRTHLPLDDILARDPSQQGADPDFFTPAEILGCNPLTILDYRKLLLDIEGVRNAWVEIDTHAPHHINGLYKACIELDEDPDDFTTTAQFEAYQDKVLCRIRQVLMAHRNLCEDFSTVYFLCDLNVGVCADIDLVSGTDVGTCYQQLIEALYAFFSPAPTFYTLQQMIDRNTPIETIFSGRPVPGGASHGFIDTTELQGIVRRKEIHVSDVYRVILSVPGVQRIRKLQLRTCPDGGTPTPLPTSCWVLTLPEHTLPVLSIPCGGFQFYLNGQPVSADLSAYNSLLQLNLTKTGKVLYPAGSPYLDAPIPTGLFRSDLGDYYSIQNDFPQVYGIGQGSLPANVLPSRLAQARQFKGYLLFFDQLLADYLAQLSHIRDLFALGTSTDPTANHTYFVGDVSSVPDLDALLRFPGTTGAAGAAAAGAAAGANTPVAGTPLAYPISIASWTTLSAPGGVTCQQVASVTPYTFASSDDRDDAMDQLTIDLVYTPPVVTTIQVTDTGRYLYAIPLSSYSFVLLSQSDFPDAVSAAQQAALVLFLGQDLANYSQANLAQAGSFGFTINQTGNSYLQYLQTILEDGETYRQRRKAFLDHLLARFAEVFTDYALLYLGNTQSAAFETGQIDAIGRFLADYPWLSANRGKAMNYLRPGWNDKNISGMERRFKAYAGIEDWDRHHLCNFEVVKLESTFLVKLLPGGEEWFVSKASFTGDEGQPAVTGLAAALGWVGNYQVVQLPDDGRYALDVSFYNGNFARSQRRYGTADAARADAVAMARLWSPWLRDPDIRVSRYEYYLALLDCDKRVVRDGRRPYDSEEEAWSNVSASLADPQDKTVWEVEPGAGRMSGDAMPEAAGEPGSPAIGTLVRNEAKGRTHQFLEEQGFNTYAEMDVPYKPRRWRFKVSDDQNNFILHSLGDFPLREEAMEACRRFLYSLADRASYGVRQDEETGFYRIVITKDGQDEAISHGGFIYRTRIAALEGGEQIWVKARKFFYEAEVRQTPSRWRWHLALGSSAMALVPLVSDAEYDSVDATTAAACEFVTGSRSWKVSERGEVRVSMGLGGSTLSAGVWGDARSAGAKGNAQSAGTAAVRANVKALVGLKQQIGQLIEGDPALVAASLIPDAKTLAGTYIYRLVDKDHPRARCPRGMATHADAEGLRKHLIHKARKGYHFLEICLGGVGVVRGSGQGEAEAPYYFQLKCRNKYFESQGFPDRDIVLFESVQGYDSPDDAQAAFTAQYLTFLAKGMDASNYGPGKWISLDPRHSIHQHPSPEGPVPQALVPVHTQHQLGIMGHNPVTVLCLACRSYPIRLIKPPIVIEPCSGPVKPDPCTSPAPPPLYGFVLFNAHTEEVDWESISGAPGNAPVGAPGGFDTIGAATDAFYFFLMLLAYPGNLFIRLDEADCKYYVKIREVLAESSHTYPTPAAAWGVNGVEKFIGVTQGPHGFHLYQRADNCGYTFWVGCPDCKLEHPCTYDTPETRDEARTRLIQAYEAVKDRDWLAGFAKQGEQGAKEGTAAGEGREQGTIYGLDGQPLAVVYKLGVKQQGDAVLDPILDIVDAAWTDGQYWSGKDGPILVDASGATIARAISTSVPLKDWKKGVQGFAQYFPVERKTQEKGGVVSRQYRFSVKLPGFPPIQDGPTYYMPCGCGPEPGSGTGCCYTAWHNHLVYTGARQAWEEYVKAFAALAEAAAYKGVFDCACGPFGIEFSGPASMIAHNPQSYYLPDEACAAVRRAKDLINAEGLEIVEHILLRPCPSEMPIPVCKGPVECDTTWKDINAQGDEESPPLRHFYPGHDPYSFIVTVALPSWPKRFSKLENRLQLETILQREAPAHILQRILWLCPHEMCRFEGFYKKWEYWLGERTPCPDYDRSAFLDFLFKTPFPCCLETYQCCLPPVTSQPSPCWTATKTLPITQGSQDWLSEINHLYCWTDMKCGEPLRLPLPPAPPPVQPPPPAQPVIEVVAARPSVQLPRAQPLPAKKAPPEPPPADEIEKARQINMRLARYQRRVNEVIPQLKDAELGKKATAFLSDQQPSARRFDTLAHELAAAYKKSRKSNRENLKILAENIAGYWLDTTGLKQESKVSNEEAKAAFEKTGLAPEDAEASRHRWDPGKLY